MKVVLFCGGLGLRIRDFCEEIPKPMVTIGIRPILWHVMKYFAHYGHREFILCLGYKADVVKRYFVNYSEYLSNDFVMTNGGNQLELLNRDIDDWTITFVDTGLSSNIGQRLRAVQRFLQDEEVFLANYSDTLTDFHLPDLMDTVVADGAVAGFLSVRPHHSFHVVRLAEDGRVRALTEVGDSGLLINGGYFVLRQQIFNCLGEGEDLVREPFCRLIAENKLVTVKHDGFWACMDTFKDRQMLEAVYARGLAPWEVWRHGSRSGRRDEHGARPRSARVLPV